eukprot:gene12295-25856_t
MIEEEHGAILRDSSRPHLGIPSAFDSEKDRALETTGSKNPSSSSKKGILYAYHPTFQRKESSEVGPVFRTCLDSLQQYLQ